LETIKNTKKQQQQQQQNWLPPVLNIAQKKRKWDLSTEKSHHLHNPKQNAERALGTRKKNCFSIKTLSALETFLFKTKHRKMI